MSYINLRSHSPKRYHGFKALWVRVIIRAAFDLASYKDDKRLVKRKEADSAYKWLFSKSLLFNSFENVCAMVGWPPDQIREWASTLTKEEVQKMEHMERSNKASVENELGRFVPFDYSDPLLEEGNAGEF